MSIHVRIPSLLRRQTRGEEVVLIAGETIGEVLEGLEDRFAGLRGKLRDQEGRIRRFVNVYINDSDVRLMKGITTPVADGDEVTIIPAVAGG